MFLVCTVSLYEIIFIFEKLLSYDWGRAEFYQRVTKIIFSPGDLLSLFNLFPPFFSESLKLMNLRNINDSFILEKFLSIQNKLLVVQFISIDFLFLPWREVSFFLSKLNGQKCPFEMVGTGSISTQPILCRKDQ